MNDDLALRVLGLATGADREEVRRAVASQVRGFREARAAADDPVLQARLDRALAATLAAGGQLLKSESGTLARTQELPALLRRVPYPSLVVVGVGVLMLLAGLLLPGGEPAQPQAPMAQSAVPAAPGAVLEPAKEPAKEPATELAEAPTAEPTDSRTPAAPEPVPAPVATPARAEREVARAWLDPWRSALAQRWQRGAPFPPLTELPAELAAPPAPWRPVAQRHGGFALVDGRGAWLLAMPRRQEQSLAWGCFSTRPLQGCLSLSTTSLGADVAAGRVGPFELALALEQRSAADDGRRSSAAIGEPATWYRQALAQGDGRGAEALAARLLSTDAGATPSPERRQQAMALYEDAEAAFDAASDVAARMRVLAPMARLAALDPQQRPEETARFVLRCRALRREAGNDLSCPTPGQLGELLEARASSGEDWLRVRFWYENAVAEREPSGARGLARLLALGRAGDTDRRQALALLEDAAERWVTFRTTDAAATATQISDIWTHGWGVEVDAGEASWWASQGARLGNAGSALRLASAFALGAGTARNMDRARDVVALYSEAAPLFEVAYYRSVGERLAAGDGVNADPQSAIAWQRRAFELCQQLAGQGDADAQLELAGMYFSGDGVARDARRAAELYARLLDRAPVRAANMLAWIRATHPDRAVRDGAEALRLARAVVARAPQADYLDTLAAAQAEQGDFDGARMSQRRALELLAAEADPALGGVDVASRRADLQARLDSYARRQPWRDLAQEEQGS